MAAVDDRGVTCSEDAAMRILDDADAISGDRAGEADMRLSENAPPFCGEIVTEENKQKFLQHCVRSILAHVEGLLRVASGLETRCPHRL